MDINKIEDKFYTPLVNYYGRVEGFKTEGKYWLSLPDHSSEGDVEITEKFFNACVEEFHEFNEWVKEIKKTKPYWS